MQQAAAAGIILPWCLHACSPLHGDVLLGGREPHYHIQQVGMWTTRDMSRLGPGLHGINPLNARGGSSKTFDRTPCLKILKTLKPMQVCMGHP
jgi:hypothetical protein